ncbi:MAG: hypothetical protein RBT37_01650 [Dissulfurispiraceae bacterium]|jgi:hypothetical protein|nr:hypothetical protein [Dissulfurispiraceae bacterium]
MKAMMISYILILSVARLALARDTNQNEATCKQRVEATLAAISTVENMTGDKKDIKGLTKEAIEKMLKRMSYCEVAQEIAHKTIQ